MLTQIMEICIIPLFGILTKYLVDFLITKKEESKNSIKNSQTEKYTNMIFDTVTKCVIATNQTYVDSLKKSGSFNEVAQKEAFHRTMSAVLSILGEDAKKYIVETTGDLNTYLTQVIEAQVNRYK